jgi:hypothetical protein
MRYAHWTSTPSSMALSGYEVGQTIMALGELHAMVREQPLPSRLVEKYLGGGSVSR